MYGRTSVQAYGRTSVPAYQRTVTMLYLTLSHNITTGSAHRSEDLRCCDCYYGERQLSRSSGSPSLCHLLLSESRDCVHLIESSVCRTFS